VQVLKRELNGLEQSLTTRFEERINNLEHVQEKRTNSLQQLLEAYDQKIQDSQALLRQQIFASVDTT
jgi:hypothetical protein